MSTQTQVRPSENITSINQHSRISTIANQLRTTLNLFPIDPIPTFNPILKKLKIAYIEESFGKNTQSFSSEVSADYYLIGYNKDMSNELSFKRFAIAHELGHILLHNHIYQNDTMHKSKPECQSEDPVEQEADCFARYFLAPLKAVHHITIAKPLKKQLIHNVAEYFNMSTLSASIQTILASQEQAFALFCPKNTPNIAMYYKSSAMQKQFPNSFTGLSKARILKDVNAKDIEEFETPHFEILLAKA